MKIDALALAKLRFEELLSFFEINADVQMEEDGDSILLNVEVSDSGQLIGHRGENLRALQQLLNVMVRSRHDERVFVSVDINGYKKGRAEQLAKRAKEDAAKVIETGQEKRLRPMSAGDRRIIHMTLAEIPEVTTESVGADPRRFIVIKLKTD